MIIHVHLNKFDSESLFPLLLLLFDTSINFDDHQDPSRDPEKFSIIVGHVSL
jgi:hypothetical protein